jgi:hypothetical protein
LSRLRADRHSAGQALAAGVMRRNLDGSEAGKLTRKERDYGGCYFLGGAEELLGLGNYSRKSTAVR